MARDVPELLGRQTQMTKPEIQIKSECQMPNAEAERIRASRSSFGHSAFVIDSGFGFLHSRTRLAFPFNPAFVESELR
jgi:hypothetical protein